MEHDADGRIFDVGPKTRTIPPALEEGYRVERMSDGELRLRGPDGRVVPDVPCPPPAPSDPVSAVTIHNDAAGVAVGPRTATPTWQGERLDVRYAIDVLHPLANEKRTAA